MNGFYGNARALAMSGKFVEFVVVHTDAARRTYDVRTSCPHDLKLHDLLVRGVQQLKDTASFEGEEGGALSEPGTFGVLFFVGLTPFILGFYVPPVRKIADSPQNLGTGDGNDGAVPGSASGNAEPIDVGDRILATRGRNKVLLRRSGVIEIEASKVCRRNYFPSKNRIVDVCRIYEFNSDGVTGVNTTMELPGGAGYPTISKWQYRDDAAQPTTTFNEVKGKVSLRELGLPDTVVSCQYVAAPKAVTREWVRLIHKDGTTEEAVSTLSPLPLPATSAWYRKVSPDGTITENVNGKVVEKTVGPDGSVSLTINAEALKLGVSPTGKVEINILGADVNYKDSLNIKGAGTEFLRLGKGKLAAGNVTVEIVDAMCQLAEMLSKSLTPGYNAPLSNQPEFAALLLKLKSLKE